MKERTLFKKFFLPSALLSSVPAGALFVLVIANMPIGGPLSSVTFWYQYYIALLGLWFFVVTILFFIFGADYRQPFYLMCGTLFGGIVLYIQLKELVRFLYL